MSALSEVPDVNLCGCCDAEVEEPKHENRPGQPQLAYRIGTHPTFLRRMLARLARQEIPSGPNRGRRPLANLTTRSSEDPAIALLDALATVGDVLTFYQERIANEGYLRTATERRSVLELARAIGYELDPGVAASTYLAFKVDDSEGSPGVATIARGVQVQSIPAAQGELPQTFETIAEFEAHARWNVLKPRTTEVQTIQVGTTELFLQGVSTLLQPGDVILIVGVERDEDPGSERWDARIVQTVETFPDEGYTRVTWEEERGLGFQIGRRVLVEPAASATARVYAFRQRAALFGHNAPDWRAMPESVQDAYITSATSARPTNWPNFALEVDEANPQIDLDNIYPKILAGSWVMLAQPTYVELYRAKEVTTGSRTDFTLTAKTTRINLDTAENLGQFDRRDAVVYAQSERLPRAEKPLTMPVEGKTIELGSLVEGLRRDQPLIITGQRDPEDEEIFSEVVFVESTLDSEGYTTIILEEPLQHSYVRSTAAIYANVVPATHGETADEALGSGDGSATNQKFTLKKSPLTHVAAETPGGAKSTLEVRVNGVLWEEAPSLYNHKPTDESYVVRIDDEGRATVIFGDGKSGARLPTGQENVRARYRFGIGHEGEVGADRLTLLKTRPFAVRGATNPLPASGAANPEVLKDARVNAPLTVLTFERIVSLQDFEDFARAFAGVGKAQAVSLWNGEVYLAHVTIADDSGNEVAEASPLRQKLADAIDGSRDPTVEVEIVSFERLSFNLDATVLIEARYSAEDVEDEVEAALLEAFGFKRRAFGQPVTAAEIISVIHAVEGVVAVELNQLYLATEVPTPLGAEKPRPAAVLPAHIARREDSAILPAQLLLINNTGVSLTMMAV